MQQYFFLTKPSLVWHKATSVGHWSLSAEIANHCSTEMSYQVCVTISQNSERQNTFLRLVVLYNNKTGVNLPPGKDQIHFSLSSHLSLVFLTKLSYC